MTQRCTLFLIAAGVLCAGFALAQEPQGQPGQPEEPPLRLKKKNQPAPAKPEPAKQPQKDDKKDQAKKADPKDGDPAPTTAPQEDEAEVLQRVAKNASLVGEKLANKELTDGTRQLQDDIIKDLDSLIRAAMSPSQGGEGGGGEDSKDKDQSNQSKSPSQSGPGSMGKQQSGKQSASTSRAMRTQKREASQQAKKTGQPSGSGNPDSQQAKGPGDQGGNQQANNMGGGNNGGGGGKSPEGPKPNADLYKDVWGHLPEALRAEMNSYSNDKQFMAKYDELIKRYYRTIAEQGRRKGD